MTFQYKSVKKLTKQRVVDMIDKYRYVSEKNYTENKPSPEDLNIILDAFENQEIILSIVKSKPALFYNALVLFAANGYASPLNLLFKKVPKDQINFNQKRGKGDNAEITALTLALNLYKLGNRLSLQIIIANMTFNDLRLIEGTSQLSQLVEIAMFDKDIITEHLIVQPDFIRALQMDNTPFFNKFILAHQIRRRCHPTLLFIIMQKANLELANISDQVFAKVIDCLQMLEASNYPLPYNNTVKFLFSRRFGDFVNSKNLNIKYVSNLLGAALFCAKKFNKTFILSLLLQYFDFRKINLSKPELKELLCSIVVYIKSRDVLTDLDELLIKNLKHSGIGDPQTFFDSVLIEPLHIAIWVNDSSKVKELLAAKVPVRSLFCNLSPLALAAKVKGSDQIVRALLDAGASVDLAEHKESKNCPEIFFDALKTKNMPLVEYLVKSGINVNSKIGTQSVLHYSIQIGFYIAAIILLRNNADVNAQDPNQNTALHILLSSVILDEGAFKALAQCILVAKPNLELKNNNNQQLRQMLSDKDTRYFPLLRQATNEIHTLNRRFVNIGFILFETGLNLDVISRILAFELHLPRVFKLTRDLTHDLDKLYTSWLNWKNRMIMKVQSTIPIRIEDNNNTNYKSFEHPASKAEKNLASDEKTLCIFWNMFGNNKFAKKQLKFSNKNKVSNNNNHDRHGQDSKKRKM